MMSMQGAAPVQVTDAAQLRTVARRLGVRLDWHEPDEQGVTAKVTGRNFDNAGFGGSAAGDLAGTEAEELCVILCQNGEPVAEVNLKLVAEGVLVKVGKGRRAGSGAAISYTEAAYFTPASFAVFEAKAERKRAEVAAEARRWEAVYDVLTKDRGYDLPDDMRGNHVGLSLAE